MCSQYWTVQDDFICPSCREKSTWEIQTHEYGEVGSCVNVYPVGAAPAELADVSTKIHEPAWCSKCRANFEATIRVVDGIILDVVLQEGESAASEL